MTKDFASWHPKKEKINNDSPTPFFHEREIWFCYLGANIRFEQDGQGVDFQRPVVIIRKFNNNICWAIPLSKTEKRNQYYFAFKFDVAVTSVAILSQIRLIDGKRLSRKIGDMPEDVFTELKQKLKALLP